MKLDYRFWSGLMTANGELKDYFTGDDLGGLFPEGVGR